jgi:gliding motility-associated-like protein
VTSCPEVNALLSTDSVGGGDGQYTYDWGAGLSVLDTLTVNLLNTQTFCVTLRDGCETPPVTECTTVKITPLPPFVLSVDSVLGCKPFNVHFAVQDTTGWATVDWDFHDGPVLYGYPASIPHLYSRYGTYDLGVNVHWPNGCSFDSTLTNLITVVDMPHADFTWTPQPADIFEHEVNFTEQCGPTAVNYLWDIAGMANSTAPDTSYVFPDDIGRLYPVKLTAWNYLGCADSVTKMVNVDDRFLVYVPTAFTPDGDGLNEVLYVRGNDISDREFHFMVFDRWGEKIFDTTDRNAGWDGKMNGKAVKNGVYTWMLRAQSLYTGVNHDLMGHVTVVR